MSVETWVNLVAVVGSAATLYFLLHRPIAKLDAKIDGVGSKLDAKIDGLETKLDTKVGGFEKRLSARIDCVETKLYAKIDGVATKLDTKVGGFEKRLSAKIDSLHAELTEFRIETKEVLARHDERLAALERQRPSLIVP